MLEGMVPIKTPQGQAELGTRERGISQRHRTVLFLVDGKRTVQEVRGMAASAGVPEGCFDELLVMGLIMLPERTILMTAETRASPAGVHIDLPLPGPDSVPAEPDSFPPTSNAASATSIGPLTDVGEMPFPDSWLSPDSGDPGSLDPAVAEARLILLRAVRDEAPLAGSLTLLRLRRARTRADLEGLLDEVEVRITKPRRPLVAREIMQRVRRLLDGGGVAPPATP